MKKMLRHTSPIDLGYPCPCCGAMSFSEPPGSYSNCKVCGWEDDVVQLRWPRMCGANKLPLIEAQQRWLRTERAASASLEVCGFAREPEWRPIDPTKDNMEFDDEYEVGYPRDKTELYYWRPCYWRAK